MKPGGIDLTPATELGGRARLCVPHRERYGRAMATISVSAAREQLAQAIETAQTQAVFVERQGWRVAVLVSPERYDELMDALEDEQDAAAFDAAMREDGPNVPWERVGPDLD